jgi:hypothetical protein
MPSGTRRWRRAALVSAVVMTASASAVAVARTGAGATAGAAPRAAGKTAAHGSALPGAVGKAALTSSTPLPADCIPNASGPPTAPYQLGLVGTVHDGVLTAGPATVANISATFCGVITVVKGTPPCGATGNVVSPTDGQMFGPLSVSLTLVPDTNVSLGFTAHGGTISGTFGCGSSQNGLNVTMDATVSGSTAPLFGVSCTIGPFTIPLTGTVTGPLTDLTATLSSDDFSVPGIQSSPTCPGALPANVDAIAGLPLAPGQASASLPVTASIYQPG